MGDLKLLVQNSSQQNASVLTTGALAIVLRSPLCSGAWPYVRKHALDLTNSECSAMGDSLS